MLQIYFRLWECKIYQNRLRFPRVIDKLAATFFMPHRVQRTHSVTQSCEASWRQVIDIYLLLVLVQNFYRKTSGRKTANVGLAIHLRRELVIYDVDWLMRSNVAHVVSRY